ncbi:uncharacterized protein B0I36DRAFT_367702 [Microdochium trichocladiopsis]|uniref:Zn(2)-C6 fungal-type domain-containing protein n=1 Tax=Microdochium trichocladiopsis TaxID=1682393 RepID=A0A9P9BL38_9PEZI|nr:uncharacterized protein B0I36DRAFT_367702 [Microdochium trichocladiopsis]KAH7021282.1 hypothetical protein B0I36DRAFT_367702 [Microdochium trichocladiopsis]
MADRQGQEDAPFSEFGQGLSNADRSMFDLFQAANQSSFDFNQMPSLGDFSQMPGMDNFNPPPDLGNFNWTELQNDHGSTPFTVPEVAPGPFIPQIPLDPAIINNPALFGPAQPGLASSGPASTIPDPSGPAPTIPSSTTSSQSSARRSAAVKKPRTSRTTLGSHSCVGCRKSKTKCKVTTGSGRCDRCSTRNMECDRNVEDGRTNCSVYKELQEVIDTFSKVARELAVKICCYRHPHYREQMLSLPPQLGHTTVLKMWDANKPAPSGVPRRFLALENLRQVPMPEGNREKLKYTRQHVTTVKDACMRYIGGMLTVCDQLQANQLPEQEQIGMYQALAANGWVLDSREPLKPAEREELSARLRHEWHGGLPYPMWDDSYHNAGGASQAQIDEFEHAQAAQNGK